MSVFRLGACVRHANDLSPSWERKLGYAPTIISSANGRPRGLRGPPALIEGPPASYFELDLAGGANTYCLELREHIRDGGRDLMWIVIGFGALGLLIGNLISLASESVVKPFISFLFVFVGGSVLAFLHKLNESDRSLAGKAVLSLSCFCLIGMYSAVVITQYRLLTPRSGQLTSMSAVTNANTPAERPSASQSSVVSKPDARVTTPGATECPEFHYIRSAEIGQANSIDKQKAEGTLRLGEAYEEMYKLALAYEKEASGK